MWKLSEAKMKKNKINLERSAFEKIMREWEGSPEQKSAEEWVKKKVGIYDYDLLFRKFSRNIKNKRW